MSSPFQELLQSSLPFPGAAAWVARLPDHSVGFESFVDWFSGEQLEQLLTRMVQAAEGLPRHQLSPCRFCWVFEHARAHVAVRPDGACLAVFVEYRTNLNASAVNALLEQFLTLPAL